jgi:hypothetical protein
VSQRRQCEHCGGSGSTPVKVAAVGAHPSCGLTVRGKKDGSSSTLVGEGGDEVLQLEEETGEVGDHPTEEKGARRSSSPWRGKMVVAA